MTAYKAKTEEGECLFCEIGAHRLVTPGIFWEDDDFMAFLAIDPNTEGFSCVIPKRHFGSDVFKLPDHELSRFILAAKRVAQILENYFTDVGRIGLIMEGTGVDHAHIKLVPMHGTESLKTGVWQQVLSGQKLWFERYEGWIASASGPMAKPDALAKLAAQIKSSYCDQ